MASEDSLKEIFTDKLNAVHVEIQDVSGGCGQSFEAIIVSDQFAGKSLLQRHRLVNSVAKDTISQLHAFSQKTYTLDEWTKHQATTN
ncbi:bola protein [Syncephalis fuscata]|nr:bola protein [Syncephalis fuscata]